MKQIPKIKEKETKMRKGKLIMSLALLALIVGFAISATPIVQAGDGPIFIEEMVEMRDGVCLYTRIYLPDPAVWGLGPYPAILTRTPYGIGTPTWYGGVPPDPTDPAQWPHEVLFGYARVLQDTRGRHYSEGVDRLYTDDGLDGYDIIEWIADQDWCNGKVGMSGGSAMGITQYLAAGERPPHLVAINPVIASANLINDFTYEGQALNFETSLAWIAYQASGLSQSHIDSLGLSPWELWIVYQQYFMIIGDIMSHLGFFYPSRPVDSTWWMHLPLMDYPAISVLIPQWNEMLLHPTQDEYRDEGNVQDTIEVPTLHMGGWYDIFSRGNLEAFMAIQNRMGNQKLFMGPGSHWYSYFAPYDPYYAWFDYWLKGIDTGIMDEPPVGYYVMGAEEWRWADEWPPSGIEHTTYYMHSDGTLSTDSTDLGETPISYVYDPSDPVPTLGGRTLFMPPGSFDQRFVEPPFRNDVLVYTSDVLEEDLEVTGPIKVFLSASSNCSDTDFTAKLIDVHPDGSTMLILDGVIRGRYRESTRYAVLMEPGTVYEFTLDLGDTSQVFEAGHRIQVDISSSNFPRRDRNLNTGGQLYNETEMFVAENTIYHDAERCSYIVLPVMSPKPKVFEGTAEINTKELAYEGPAELYTLEKAVYVRFDDQWIKWEIINHVQTEDQEFYVCENGLTVTVWTKRKTGETFAEAKGPRVRFSGSAT